MSGGLRPIAGPFVAAAPTAARVRTRLRVSEQDAAVLREVGMHLGSLAGRDLAARCREGRLDAKGKAVSRRERKRGLTAESSSRYAGTITRMSDDQYRLAEQNLRAERTSLNKRIRRIEARAQVPAGEKRGRVRGYTTSRERHQKLIRLKSLKARLAEVERQLADGSVSVVRGGKALLRMRENLDDIGVTPEEWRPVWEAKRLFLKADGDKEAPWGNYTITWQPEEHWLEVNLPAPLAHLANQPRGRYRLSCPVEFKYRSGEAAAQAETGAIGYNITYNPASRRWYVDAVWKTSPPPAASLEELAAGCVVAVDVNAGHLAVAVVAADGNIIGSPFTIGLDLARLPTATRDGRLRSAITTLIGVAKAHGARAVVIEDLNFAEAREEGRERAGSRPSRGQRGKVFRRTVADIPTGKFRDRLVQMTSNAGISVIVADPAYTSRWGTLHWLALLQKEHPETTGHHAAALVIGRRGLGHRARTRVNGNRTDPEETARPARTRNRKPPRAKPAHRKQAAPRGPRQPSGDKTGRPHGIAARDQVHENHSRAPAEPILDTAQR